MVDSPWENGSSKPSYPVILVYNDMNDEVFNKIVDVLISAIKLFDHELSDDKCKKILAQIGVRLQLQELQNANRTSEGK